MPPYISALWFVCRILGVTADELAPYHRQTILRATKGTQISSATISDLEQKMTLALYERLRRHDRAPMGQARQVLDLIVTYSLNSYRVIAPMIQVTPNQLAAAHKVLIREVWAPTLYAIFLKHHVYGLGGEFRVPGHWYLPEEIDGQFRLPVTVLLDRWLRTTGLRTAYGITKSTIQRPTEKQAKAWAAEKKKLENWLSGRVTPTLRDLFRVVDDYAQECAWLDSADSWKARFLLAHVLSKACLEAEGLCEEEPSRFRAQIAELFHRLNAEGVWDDDEGVLSDPFHYFAVRLWLKDLEATGELDRVLDAVPKQISRSFGPEVTDAEIEGTRRRDEWESKPGNHIAAYLARLADVPQAPRDMKELFAGDDKQRAYLLSVAAKRLTEMIAEEVKNAGERDAHPADSS